MTLENVTVYQLSKNNLCVSFHKNALAALKDGGSLALKVKVGRKPVTVLFMRDTAFQARLSEFRQSKQFKDAAHVPLWQRTKTRLASIFKTKPRVSVRDTPNRPAVNVNGG